jgi:Flp pilus assembly pilin Flp
MIGVNRIDSIIAVDAIAVAVAGGKLVLTPQHQGCHSSGQSGVTEIHMFLRFIQDESGQDLIEYALLSFFIGICAVVAWNNIPSKIGNAYANWDSSVQALSACTPNPGGGGCP